MAMLDLLLSATESNKAANGGWILPLNRDENTPPVILPSRI